MIFEISDKQILKTKIIDATINAAWLKWTTPDGLRTFFGSDNFIELTPGGAYEIYFMMDSPKGERGSETCKVLSFIPEKMLSFTWNAPPEFTEGRNSKHYTWVVVEFENVSINQTKIILTHLGWLNGEQWDAVFNYFDKAWDFVLNGLEKSCSIK